jgi:hypothetical protein
MRVRLILFLMSACASLIAAALPAGAELHVRLKTPVIASSAKAGQPVAAVLVVPLLDPSGAILIPSGAKVSGILENITPAAGGVRANVRPVFNELDPPGCSPVRIAAQVAEVDNARESVDGKGDIVGILASETLSARIDTGIGKIAERYPALGELLGGLKSGIVAEANPDIHYDPGVEMTLRLTKPAAIGAKTFVPAVPGAIAPVDELVRMVNAQPFRTWAQKPPKPSDITNLMFIGSESDLEAAFQSAGWTVAQALNGQSTMETIRAVIEARGYKEGPVSLLTLDGQAPDLIFEKTNNTFAKRHHIRIWRRPGAFSGLPVWVASATHDTGIDFSEENRTFIHRIDSNIDHERAKVVGDLLFSGKVTGLSLVDRSAVPTRAENGTGDALITDGRMAVLRF